MALGVLRWMRKHWSGRSVLLPLPATGVCDHSYGAMLACRVAASQPVSAVASMSAGWHEWPTYGPLPFPSSSSPSHRCTCGAPKVSSPMRSQTTTSARSSGHVTKIVLQGGEHWLYLPGQTGGCAPSAGGCHLLGAVAADLLAGFFARHLPPSERAHAGAAIPLSLVPPEIDQRVLIGVMEPEAVREIASERDAQNDRESDPKAVLHGLFLTVRQQQGRPEAGRALLGFLFETQEANRVVIENVSLLLVRQEGLAAEQQQRGD
jgi:hypothetical protein